jgi:serine/threonine protein kinase
MDRTTGKLIGCLKFVEDGAKEREIEILQYLAALPSELNHTVRPFGIWSVTGGSIIAMPAAGDRLTSLTDLDAHLWSLTRQLFEAVEFMHDHNVAHMDLKPANILVPSTYGRLTIIDFGISVRLRNKTELLQGHAGTQGYIAPEVGNTKFSPIRADLWSVGKIVKELCMLCRPSTYRDWLSVLSELLLNDNPKKRPMMLEVLEWMSNLDASETQPSGHLRYLLVTHHDELKSKVGATIKIESADGNKTVFDDSWPRPLQLRNGALIQQTVLIRAVWQCPEAIRKTLFMKRAWPQFHKGLHYIRNFLEGVKKNIEDDEGKQDVQYKAMIAQLSKDKKFSVEVCKWVCNSLVTS